LQLLEKRGAAETWIPAFAGKTESLRRSAAQSQFLHTLFCNEGPDFLVRGIAGLDQPLGQLVIVGESPRATTTAPVRVVRSIIRQGLWGVIA
jgi:hypothetical protein